ncbi:DUF47 domain-containing protein [candidate division KSB1 bacterium]|nr:MAG: DUF47 domain-containing protein [candidate division KSB1 bacterium]
MFNQAAHNINEGARLLKQMLKTFDNLEEYARKIKHLEDEGDSLTHDIIRRLNQTFITPFDREDIYSLTEALDDVLDFIDAAADWIVTLKIPHPPMEAIQLSEIIYASTQEIEKGISNLHNLKNVYKHCVEINRLENDADTLLRQGLARLFENNTDPIKIIKLKDFFEDLESATDRCEDVADVLEAIAVKNM